MSDLLIDITDIKKYRDISSNIDSSRIDSQISSAQIEDLRAVLGDPLYLDFVTKVFDTGSADYTKYQELLNGKQYTYEGNTIEFYGIKPMLVRYAYANIVRTQNVNVTRFGVNRKLTDQSEPIEKADLSNEIRDAKNHALVYQENTIKFLTNNTTDYPLYSVDESTDPNNSGGFEFVIAKNVDDRFDSSYNTNVTP